jgi:hypothetical protein
MVERTQIDRVIDEQGFQRSSLTEDQMVRIGEILNVSKIVVGDVNIARGQYNVDVRVVNVEGGTIAAAEGAAFEGSSYREHMKSIAQKLAGKIAISAGPTVSAQPTPSSPTPKKRTSVEKVYGYLHVFPNELGIFQGHPNSVIANINNQGMFGYDEWRVPTNEELSLLRANGYLSSAQYMTKENASGMVLLVTTGKTVAEKEAIKAEEARAAEIARKKSAALQAEIARQKEAERQAEIARQKEAERQAEIARPKKNIITHEYVDLGLSVKWATCNVGAAKPEDYGDYFAWGETELKSTYYWSTYKWCYGSYNTQTKYCTSSEYGSIDNRRTLDLSDDAARVNWGGSWRMPTKAEQEELRENCSWTWVCQNGVYGYRVTSKKQGYTNKSIFLPAAGYRRNSLLNSAGDFGNYWSSSLDTDSPDCAYYLFFGSSGKGQTSNKRYDGCSVRPVMDVEYVDLGLPSGTRWKEVNEDGFYDYDKAVSKFGSKLPTRQQLQELKNKCTWTWTGDGYKVIGPNGNSIFLPLTGIRYCDGDVKFVGTGYCWSSTPNDSDDAWYLYFYSRGVYMNYYRRCCGLSVRLVKNL